MVFSDLAFDKIGCCSADAWAVVRHPSGIRTEVAHSGTGWTATTFGGNTVLRGSEFLPTVEAVNARLAADALLK